MQRMSATRILGFALMAVGALALAGCGGPKKRITTTVTTTTPAKVAPVPGASAGVSTGTAAGVTAANGVDPAADSGARQGGNAGGNAAKTASDARDHGQTGGHLLAGGVGFGVLSQGIVDAGLAGGTAAASGAGAAAGGAGLAGAASGQCQNPFGSQPAGNGQLICSPDEERLQCQCDADGCQLVPTGVMSCIPVGAVYQ